MVVYILAVHVLLSEIAALILKNLAIHRQDLREQTNFSLFLELVAGISIDEYSFASCVSM